MHKQHKDIIVQDPASQTSDQGKDHLLKTSATTVVQQDTGRLTVPKKITSLTTPAVPKEVLSLIDFNSCLDAHEYENEAVQDYNVKGRLCITRSFAILEIQTFIG